MFAGGTESCINRLGIAGFAACKALSTSFNETPAKASRPYDKDRDGFVMGEGSGMLILEELDHARARGAKIYAEIVGYGLSGDAYHITSPPEDGDGAFRCMKAALKRAGIAPTEIDYINAHGTSTPVGDEIELRAVERIMDGKVERLSMSSTKSSTGHLLGAAGGVEAIFSFWRFVTMSARRLESGQSFGCDEHRSRSQPPAEERGQHSSVQFFWFWCTNASIVMRRYAG